MNAAIRLVVITGLPGTGKTTLSKQISQALSIPLIAKDAIKEIMYDTIGWSDKVWSAKLAQATFAIMEHMIEQQLRAGNSIILESNYSPKLASEKFQYWQKQYGCSILQIVCQTEIDTLAHRFDARNRINRHPGHIDDGTITEHREDFLRRIENGEDRPLNVVSEVLTIDTTDFTKVDLAKTVQWLESK